MEETCTFVSINGIARSCDVFPKCIKHNDETFNAEDYECIKNGDSIFIVTDCVKHFVKEVLPKLKEKCIKIKVVTGASDISVPNRLDSLDNVNYLNVFGDTIIHWFCQNFDNPTDVEEYTCIPLGLDFHTNQDISPLEQEKKLKQLYKSSLPFEDRLKRSLSCFQFRLFSDKTHDKWKAMEVLNEIDFNDVLKEKKDREYLWELMCKYRFIICPKSSGIDTHLIYESILLGCVPITCRSTISHMHIDLPILILNDWNELTNDSWNVFNGIHEFRDFNIETTKLEYWTELIKEK